MIEDWWVQLLSYIRNLLQYLHLLYIMHVYLHSNP